MRKGIFLLTGFAFFSSALTFASVPAGSLPAKGGVLPAFTLPVPKIPEERNYLGLPGSGFFKIPQIKAKVVIINLFSMYCPICQTEAPEVKALHDLFGLDRDLSVKVKMIGIGTGNSAYEVEVFKKTYQIPFPLFADGDFIAHKAFGEARTPSFIVVRLGEKGAHEVVLSQEGGFPGAEPFLEQVLKETGLK